MSGATHKVIFTPSGIRATAQDGQSVFDVFTKSIEKAADGTAYAEW